MFTKHVSINRSQQGYSERTSHNGTSVTQVIEIMHNYYHKDNKITRKLALGTFKVPEKYIFEFETVLLADTKISSDADSAIKNDRLLMATLAHQFLKTASEIRRDLVQNFSNLIL